jgi:arsenate reductase-like glutaredoxin family protein
MSCVKAQGFLEKKGARAQSVTDAKKERKGRAEALALAESVARIVVAKGKSIVTFDLKKDRPDDDTLASHLLGPTGNLRAPTARRGKTLYVGFHEDTYRELTKE